MPDTTTFTEWTTNVLAHSALITNTIAALSDKHLCHTFEAGMCDSLCREYQRTENAATDAIDPTAKNTLFDWITVVTLIDDNSNYNEQTARRMAAELAASNASRFPNTKWKTPDAVDGN
ncbi:hypothetical protein C0991_010269 [Blastosporella zonata]|nr:hypothetical protein C0991_010269 [Blastosporella zonata]